MRFLIKKCRHLSVSGDSNTPVQVTSASAGNGIGAQLNSSSSSSAALCLDCRGPDGLCYNPDPASCSSFLQCSQTAGDTASVAWTHSVIACQPRTFWSQDALTCVHPEDSSCIRRGLSFNFLSFQYGLFPSLSAKR